MEAECTMKNMFRILLSVMLLGICFFCNKESASAATPVNGNASNEVRQVLNYLENISGNQIIAGQHDKPSYPTQTYDRVYQITGSYPGIWGGDFGFMSGPNDTIYNREELVNQAIMKWNQGSIPAWTWHMVRPDKAEPNTWEAGVLCYAMSDYEFQQMTTPGTSFYQCFISRIDSVVWAFQALKEAGVPVLWRPFHEMNANWFWWGGNPTYSPKLYQIMYDRYTNYWGLDNIIWVWNVDRPINGAIEQYYPGSQYVDVLSMDIYNNDYKYEYYQTMLNLANGKPIALGEVGELPAVSILWQQPKWAYFMCWTEHLEGNNSLSFINDIYWQDKVITRGEISLDNVGMIGENIAYRKPVEVSSEESSEYSGSKAVDADGTTRWASAFADEQYIIVDLEETKNISGVKLSWEAAYASQYQIQVSNDYDNWTTVYSNYDAVGGTRYINVNAAARYVKVYCIRRATQYGFSLYEFEIY